MIEVRPWVSDLAEFVPATLPDSGRSVFSSPISRGDLFRSLNELVDAMQSDAASDESSDVDTPLAAFVLNKHLAITVNRTLIKPALMQCVLLAVGAVANNKLQAADSSGHLRPHVLDATRELTLWSANIDPTPYEAAWQELSRSEPLATVEVATVLKLYGNKTRLIEFIGGAFSAIAPEGSHVLDLMAGTGIVSRALAARYRVTANDANPYAALLTRGQGEHIDHDEVAPTLAAIAPPYEANFLSLRNEIQAPLDAEAAFLHEEFNSEAMLEYEQFCRQPVLEKIGSAGSFPFKLFAERFANTYFGVLQCAEIDSLRYAIDTVMPEIGRLRTICLNALLIAVSTCSSGPHFAQPPVLKSRSSGALKSLKAFRVLAEKRARSVQWEFELALSRLSERPQTKYPISTVMQRDWRAAISAFSQMAGAPGSKFIYVDPPYSKLQYSRYYHVLNTLLAYDYPTVEGVGLYPPREARFSSKFEYQPGTARKELDALFAAASYAELPLVVSYSDTGFVKIDDLLELAKKYYRRTDVLFERLRHHSQGVHMANGSTQIIEYLAILR